jgi:ribosomal protein L19E
MACAQGKKACGHARKVRVQAKKKGRRSGIGSLAGKARSLTHREKSFAGKA